MDCDIIRDLLPLYADGLASEASSHQIKEHTARCPACKKLLDDMTAPLEPKPEDEEQKIMGILREQRRKQRRKNLLTWAGILIALVLIVWGMMEIRYSGDLISVASTNQEKILKEMPNLALTAAEQELAQTILDAPIIRDALSDDYASPTVLNPSDAVGYFSSILPEGADIVEISVSGHNVYVSYTSGNIYTIISYNDLDMTGHVDTIYKCVAVSPLDKIGSDGKLGDVDVVYDLTHSVADGISRYQKYKSRHMWFGFLDMP